MINHNLEKTVLRFILCSFGLLALLYILFLGNMVKNIIERRSLEADARTLSNEVGNLELNYLSLSNSVDLPLSLDYAGRDLLPLAQLPGLRRGR